MIKFLFFLATGILLVFAFVVIYENLPGEAFQLNTNIEKTPSLNISAKTPMFLENMRFDHDNISYSIEGSCSEARADYMKESFGILSSQVKEISFYKTSNNADIEISCSERYPRVNNNFFIAGEGGPVEIQKNGRFNIIKNGVIYLYREETCKNPSVEIHELLHVFGFAHSNDNANVMYNVTSCHQEISSDMIKTLINLYSIPPLPDLRIENLSVIKKGNFLDFNVTIINDGLKDSGNTSIVLLSNNKEIKTFNVGIIEMGYAKTLYDTNTKLPNNVNIIDFYVDYENKVVELDENNNHATAS